MIIMRTWLKKLREQKKLRQIDVAKALNISCQQYSLIELGKRQEDMNLSTAAKISDFFDIPLSKIRCFEEESTAGKDTA